MPLPPQVSLYLSPWFLEIPIYRSSGLRHKCRRRFCLITKQLPPTMVLPKKKKKKLCLDLLQGPPKRRCKRKFHPPIEIQRLSTKDPHCIFDYFIPLDHYIRTRKLHRHRPQIASTHPNCQRKNKTRKELSICDREERQGGSGSQEQPRPEIMKGDKVGRQGGSHEQPTMEIIDKAAAAAKSSQTQGDKADRAAGQPRPGQNGDHAGRQMKVD